MNYVIAITDFIEEMIALGLVKDGSRIYNSRFPKSQQFCFSVVALYFFLLKMVIIRSAMNTMQKPAWNAERGSCENPRTVLQGQAIKNNTKTHYEPALLIVQTSIPASVVPRTGPRPLNYSTPPSC